MKNAFMSSHHTEDLQKLSFHLLCVEWQLLLNASFNSAWSPSIQREIWHRAPMAAQQIKISKGQWLLVTWGPELEPPPPPPWCCLDVMGKLTAGGSHSDQRPGKSHQQGDICRGSLRQNTSILLTPPLLYFSSIYCTVSYVPLRIKQGNHIFEKQIK